MRIGELAKQSGLSVSSIRFYEAQGLIAVSRRANGYRTYAADALVALNIITSARDAGFKLAEIRRLMPSEVARCRDGALVGALRQKAEDLRSLEQRLAETRAQLEDFIAEIEARPEGLSHEANADRVLKRFKGARSKQVVDA